MPFPLSLSHLNCLNFYFKKKKKTVRTELFAIFACHVKEKGISFSQNLKFLFEI